MGQSGNVTTQGPVGSTSLENLDTLNKSSEPRAQNTPQNTYGRSFTDSPSACSSALAHLITAVVLAIVVGAAATATAYFLAGQNILYTTLAGSAGFVITGLATYLMMRIFLGAPEIPPEEVTSELPHY